MFDRWGKTVRFAAGGTALAAMAAIGVTLAPLAGAAGTPAPGSVPPDQDPFYSAPANIASYQPGQIVASRPVNVGSTLGLPSGTSGWQISYRTNDSHLNPEMTVTTLLVPPTAWTGNGPRPVVSEQMPEDSTGTQCSPSYSMATGSVEYAFLVSASLNKNWAVAMPDFEGPKSAFMAGPQAAHAVLDGIRAVKNFDTAGIGAANPYALDGYSGGAEATGWAVQTQPSYAPDVTLAGAAIGGTPADPAVLARSIDGGPFSGFEFAATVGLNADFPEANIPSVLNAQGQQDEAKAENKCLTDLLTGFAFRTLASDANVPQPLSVPSIAAVLAENTLGGAAPAAPVYDYHADTDEIVPVGQDNTLTQAWCSKGANVQVVRDLLGEHALEALLRQGSAISFLADRFAGKPAMSSC